MERLFTEASLSDSYIYSEFNRSSNISTTIASAIKTGVKLDSTFIEQQLIQCKRSRISPISEKVLAAYENGEIILIYNKQVRVSTMLPFVVISMGNKTAAYIFISDFSGLTKDKSSLNIEMKKLYVLMESAYIGKCFYTKPELFKRSNALMKIFTNIYADMNSNILNREYNVSSDKNIYDKSHYCMARFELEKMAELRSSDIIHSYASGTCLNPNKIILDNMGIEYTEATITSINDLIKLLSTLNHNMSSINIRYYFERWVSTFGQTATFAIDELPYLYLVIIDGLLGSYLTNAKLMSDIAKKTKGINLFYSEISKIF